MAKLVSFLTVFLLSAAGVAGQNLGRSAFCDGISQPMSTNTFVLEEGPFIRHDGQHVGQMDLGIRRYGWSARAFNQFRCAIDGVEFRFDVRDSRDDPENYIHFRILGRQVNGSIVLRDRYGQTVLSFSRPTSENRQQSIRVEYFEEQDVADVFRDVVFISGAWEG